MAEPKVNDGSTLCLLWEELQSYMAEGMDPGKGDELGQ